MNRPKYFGPGLPYIESDAWPGILIAAEGSDGAGCTTQLQKLRQWLEVQGYGVAETAWTHRRTMAEQIADFHQRKPLDAYTYSLAYATDFADSLEKEVLPALRNGFIVLANRYVFTALARDVVRGADAQWVRDLFGFAPVPDLVLYFQVDANTLLHRALTSGRLGAEEAGTDLRLGDDVFDCFKRYQTRVIREYNKLADEFEFRTISSRRSAETVQKDVRQVVARLLERRQQALPAEEDGEQPADLPADGQASGSDQV